MPFTKEPRQATKHVSEELQRRDWDHPHHPGGNNNNKECPSGSVEVKYALILAIFKISYLIYKVRLP